MTIVDDIDDIIRMRRTKRAFLRKPVKQAVVREILSVASFAPSSSNTQPWRCYVLTGQARDRVSTGALAAWQASAEQLVADYPYFPQVLPKPYGERFNLFRRELGDVKEMGQADLHSDISCCRVQYMERQFQFFNAPIGIIFTIDRRLEAGSFLCYGTFLQNIMLAAKARGLDTCAQQVWSMQQVFLRQELSLCEHEMVIAGLALGWADNRVVVNRLPMQKLGIDDFATFLRG